LQNLHLCREETNVSSTANPLPTIGLEIESPVLIHKQKDIQTEYAAFFDALNFPHNDANTGTFGYFEISTSPSYHWGTQARTLTELIKGGFVPRCLNSDEPGDIRKYLSSRLISLHVNLGIPLVQAGEIEKNYGSVSGTADTDDVKLFAISLALSYTSPLRLQARHCAETFEFKESENTPKTSSRHPRLELKALEVRDRNTYRAIAAAQYLGSSLFSALGTQQSDLTTVWSEAKRTMTKALAIQGNTSIKNVDKNDLVDLAYKDGLSSQMRTIVEFYTLMAKQVAQR